MRVLVFGGAGFVGLNIVEALLGQGHEVIAFDRSPMPSTAVRVFAALPGRLEAITGDVIDGAAVTETIRPGLDAIVLGSAITADATRDGADPETILSVNLMAQIPILERARDVGTGRIVNLSSGIVHGGVGEREPVLTEETGVDPVGLYAISKYATERVGTRLAGLWGIDHVNVRLSSVFGPWELATQARDTLSPQRQMASLLGTGRPALLARSGWRDWIYAPDVAEAVIRLIAAPRPASRLFNVSTPDRWPALDWGRRLGALDPDLVCRLAEPGETPTIHLHALVDRAPLSTDRMRDELGWVARFGMQDSADHFVGWWRRHGSTVDGP